MQIISIRTRETARRKKNEEYQNQKTDDLDDNIKIKCILKTTTGSIKNETLDATYEENDSSEVTGH